MRAPCTAQAQLNAEAQQVIDLETRLAKAAKTSADTFAPNAVKDLAKRYRNLQTEAFLKAQGVNAQQVSLADTAYFAQIDKLIAGLKPAQWKTYLRFHVGHAMAPYLGKAWRDAEHEFQGRMLRGEDEPAPHWRRTLDAIEIHADDVLAQEYAAKYMPVAHRERVQAITQQVRDALTAAVERNTWMDAQAKTEARAKLDALRVGIGAPQQLADITGLGIARSGFGANVLAAKSWAHREAMKRIGHGNPETAWAIAPHTPALRYDLAENRLLVTAAVLQPPVFEMSQSMAAQYGGLGALIGHELGRAVDGKGRRVDASGSARDWWTPATAAAWDARIAPLSARYGAIAYPGQATLKVDGARTREENAADLSGLELAWAAYEKADAQAKAGDQQNFFRGWARLWAQAFSTEAAVAHAAHSAHAPGVARTNAVVMQLPAFAKAYACKAGSAMLLNDAERVSIWR